MRPINPLLAGLLLVASAPAMAEFHLMLIREVYVGPATDPNAQYVELQMYSSGQNFVDGHDLTFYGPTGTLLGTVTFTDDVPNGGNQSFILIATNEAVTRFSETADLVMTPLLNPAAGRVCFDSVDCFSWGNFSAASSPSPTGNPFNPSGGLTADTAVTRDISGGTNAAALDAGDDTNNSAADFDFAASPNPTNNGPAGGGGPVGGGGGGGGGGGAFTAWLLLALLGARPLVAAQRRRG